MMNHHYIRSLIESGDEVALLAYFVDRRDRRHARTAELGPSTIAANQSILDDQEKDDEKAAASHTTDRNDRTAKLRLLVVKENAKIVATQEKADERADAEDAAAFEKFRTMLTQRNGAVTQDDGEDDEEDEEEAAEEDAAPQEVLPTNVTQRYVEMNNRLLTPLHGTPMTAMTTPLSSARRSGRRAPVTPSAMVSGRSLSPLAEDRPLAPPANRPVVISSKPLSLYVLELVKDGNGTLAVPTKIAEGILDVQQVVAVSNVVVFLQNGKLVPWPTASEKTDSSMGLDLDEAIDRVFSDGYSKLVALERDTGKVHNYYYNGMGAFFKKKTDAILPSCQAIAFSKHYTHILEGDPDLCGKNPLCLRTVQKSREEPRVDKMYPLKKKRSKATMAGFDNPLIVAVDTNNNGKLCEVKNGFLENLNNFNNGDVHEIVSTKSIAFVRAMNGQIFWRNEEDKKFYEIELGLEGSREVLNLEAGGFFVMGMIGKTGEDGVVRDTTEIVMVEHDADARFKLGTFDFKDIHPGAHKIAAMKASKSKACFLIEDVDNGATTNLNEALAMAADEETQA